MSFFEITEVELIEACSKKNETIYKIVGLAQKNNEEIARRTKEAGRFILATNLVEEHKLEPEAILITYKNQQSSERGFRLMIRSFIFCR